MYTQYLKRWFVNIHLLSCTKFLFFICLRNCKINHWQRLELAKPEGRRKHDHLGQQWEHWRGYWHSEDKCKCLQQHWLDPQDYPQLQTRVLEQGNFQAQGFWHRPSSSVDKSVLLAPVLLEKGLPNSRPARFSTSSGCFCKPGKGHKNLVVVTNNSHYQPTKQDPNYVLAFWNPTTWVACKPLRTLPIVPRKKKRPDLRKSQFYCTWKWRWLIVAKAPRLL